MRVRGWNEKERVRRQSKSFPNKKKSHNSDKILCAYFLLTSLNLFIVITIIFKMREGERVGGNEYFEMGQSKTTTTFCRHQCKMFRKSVFLSADVSLCLCARTHFGTMVHQTKKQCNN